MGNSKVYPPVVVVDENDTEIGFAPLEEVWEKGLYHRIVSIFIMDAEGCMLLQLRGPDVKIYPNCWDQAAGGHVDAGQSYEQTAHLELAEELDIKNVPLRELGTHRTNMREDGRTFNQFERAYTAQIPRNTRLRPQAEEINRLRWFTTAELKLVITQNPKQCTPGLIFSLKKYFPSFGL